MSTAAGRASALDAQVTTGVDVAAYRATLADEADEAVRTIKAKIKGLERSLRDKEREAKQLRAEAEES
jgi:prefoldin subunit 5